MSPRQRERVVKNQLYFFILEFFVDNVFLERIKGKKNPKHNKDPLKEYL